MADSLNDFYQQLNADIQAPHCIIPSAPDQPVSDIIAPLHHYGLLQIQGPDAATFLQGQTTCDVLGISEGTATYGGYCTPKGRLLSSFLLARSDEQTYLLRMRESIVEPSKQAFGKYIVFSKAEQTILNDQVIAIGLYGEKAANLISQTLGACPDKALGFINHDGHTVIQLDDAGQMFECWIAIDQLSKLWPALSEGLTVVGSDHWEYLTIQAGLGEVTEQTIESFIPQMLNYEFTGHINFQKGCYTGQEVVARLHYKGTAKRRLFRCRYQGEAVAPGTELLKEGSDQSIGNIVNCIEHAAGHCECLAVITVSDIENNTAIVTKNGYQLEPLTLPYAITNEA